MKFSQIKQIKISELKINPDNKKYFRVLDGAEYNNLFASIKKDGIKVPLIATKDNLLLAGHTRLSIAKELKFKTVPIMFIEEKLSKEKELNFMVSDNLLRRHLSSEDRKQLYSVTFKNFEERVLRKHSRDSITSDMVHEKTGIAKSTASRDMDMIRREAEKKMVLTTPNERKERMIANYRQSLVKIVNFAVLEDKEFINNCIEITKTALERFNTMSENK